MSGEAKHPNLGSSFISHGAAQTRIVQKAAWAAIKAASEGDVDGMVDMAMTIIDAADKREELLAFAKELAKKEKWHRENPGVRPPDLTSEIPPFRPEPPPFRSKKVVTSRTGT